MHFYYKYYTYQCACFFNINKNSHNHNNVLHCPNVFINEKQCTKITVCPKLHLQ